MVQSNPFNERSEEYDRWFEDSQVYPLELAAIRAVKTILPGPRLEIGVGPGRFAQALEIDYGIDAAVSPLHLAKGRGIIVIHGTGEHLPIRTATIGTVYLLFTLCFLALPDAVIRECARVLRPTGRLIAGIIPGDSPWGRRLRSKGEAGNPFYRHARFHTIEETEAMLNHHGFQVQETWSTLRQPPGDDIADEQPIARADEHAGFCVLAAVQQGVGK